MNKDSLSQAKELVENSQEIIYYRWYGKLFSEADPFTRLDKTYLYLLRCIEGEARIQRIVAYLDSPPREEPSVVFSSGTVYRITEGDHRGKIVPADRIKEGEQISIAGICKYLRLTSSQGCLRLSNPVDRYILEILDELIQDGSVYTDEVSYPNLYLCTNKHNNIIFSRKGEEALQYICAQKGFNVKDTVDANLKALRFQLQIPAGKQRVAYPFEYVFGKGVLAVDPSLNGQWYSIPIKQAVLNKPWLSVNLTEDISA